LERTKTITTKQCRCQRWYDKL